MLTRAHSQCVCYGRGSDEKLPDSCLSTIRTLPPRMKAIVEIQVDLCPQSSGDERVSPTTVCLSNIFRLLTFLLLCRRIPCYLWCDVSQHTKIRHSHERC